jgi:antitoxin component YwqK of YwqJK toxin-antitoxin module
LETQTEKLKKTKLKHIVLLFLVFGSVLAVGCQKDTAAEKSARATSRAKAAQKPKSKTPTSSTATQKGTVTGRTKKDKNTPQLTKTIQNNSNDNCRTRHTQCSFACPTGSTLVRDFGPLSELACTKNGVSHGKRILWFYKTKLHEAFRREEYVDNGHTTREALEFWDNGNKKSVQTPNGSNGIRTTAWYRSGEKKFLYVGDFLIDIPTIRTTWYRNGEIKEVTRWKKDLFHGVQQTFYKNGQTHEELMWHEGRIHGKRAAWYENGQKYGVSHYVLGSKHGKSTKWHSNGQKKYEGVYKMGKAIKEKCWDEKDKKVPCKAK